MSDGASHAYIWTHGESYSVIVAGYERFFMDDFVKVWSSDREQFTCLTCILV
jgi:hypothetical protein